MLSPFGVEHSVSKSRERAGDVAAAGAGAALGGRAGYSVQQRVNGAKIGRHFGLAVESLTDAARAAMKGNDTDRVLHAMAGGEHRLTARKYMARSESRGRMGAAIAAGSALGAVGASAARRRIRRQGVHKSAFGVEHSVSKAVRLDRALGATRKPAKVKLAPVKTPLADARFGPVKKGAAAVVDDALVTPARLRVAGPKPQKQVPPAEAKPAKPLGQRLNNAIAATGGPSS